MFVSMQRDRLLLTWLWLGRFVGFCMLCEMESHVARCLTGPAQAFCPKKIVGKLRCTYFISKNLRGSDLLQ